MEENLNSYVQIKLNNHKTPEFKEEKGKDWVLYGIESPWRNLYPNYLLWLFDRSNQHKKIISAKAKYIAGNGIEVYKTGLSVAQVADLQHRGLRANKHGETVADIAFKCALDRQIFKGSLLEITWKKNQIDFDYNHVDFTKYRRDIDDDGYWYSNDWSKLKQAPADDKCKNTELEFIPDFDPENPKGKQIYALKPYCPGKKFYSVPDYLGCVPYVECEIEMANFDMTRIKTGFYAGTILNFPGKPSDTEQKDLEKKLKQKFTGTDNANSILLTFSKDKDSVPTVVRLSPDEFDKQFEQLDKKTEKEIFKGHGVTNPALFGIRQEGVTFGRSDIIESWELFKRTEVDCEQAEIEKWLNNLLFYKGFKDRIKLKTSLPISALSSEQIFSIMTEDEKRMSAGLPVIEKNSQKLSKQPVTKEEEDCAIEEMKLFTQVGEEKGNYELFGGIEVEFYESEPGKFSILEGEVKEIYKSILDLLSKDPLMSNEDIAKVLKTDKSKVAKAISALIEAEGLKEGEKKIAGEVTRQLTVTKEGRSIISNDESKVADIEVKYDYQPRPGLKPVIPGTRPFCRELLKLNRLYTRKELDALSKKLGYNVWSDKGGWWRRKGSDIVTSSCRHIWQQVLVKRKK